MQHMLNEGHSAEDGWPEFLFPRKTAGVVVDSRRPVLAVTSGNHNRSAVPWLCDVPHDSPRHLTSFVDQQT